MRVLDVINLLWWWLDAAIDEGNETVAFDIVAHGYLPIVYSVGSELGDGVKIMIHINRMWVITGRW
ncbi:hypothetical protein HanPSC8_Chr13g0567861 [Helianthus annuus]|nr:hypothetical protein HanIR_Chr07g0323911 [Helianthus annuus]KAJ0849358.1 hypothetical protein HanPSC8_Chr13g0567861 [Helianthus annuus]